MRTLPIERPVVARPSARRAARAPSTLVAALALAASLACASSASSASAQEMNVTLARLRTPAADGTPCFATVAAPGGGASTRSYCGDDAAWAGIAQQLGISMAPPVLTPGNTLGPSGFYVGLEGFITNISGGRGFWLRGTEGDATAAIEGENRFTSGSLYWQRLQVRKSLPLGFELGTSMAHLFTTSYWSLGFDIKWSILEGFRTGGEGFIPDLAVRGAVQTLLGESEFNLTIPSLELILSKGFTVAHAGTITPYLAGQYVWVLADSELVDLTPGADAATGGTSAYNDNYVFDQIRSNRLRGVIGLQGRYGVLTLTGAVVFDLDQVDDPTAGNGDAPTADELAQKLPRQWSANFGVGFSF